MHHSLHISLQTLPLLICQRAQSIAKDEMLQQTVGKGTAYEHMLEKYQQHKYRTALGSLHADFAWTRATYHTTRYWCDDATHVALSHMYAIAGYANP